MPITLRIIDREQLPDGGPIEFTAGARGFDIGREQHLDWCLPDPERFVSGHHCRIRYRDGGYWLEDISTNGTFVNGAAMRVKSPYRLAEGDRLQIGSYQISVSLGGGGVISGQSPFANSPSTPAPVDNGFGASPFGSEMRSPPAANSSAHDIWAMRVAAAPAPVDRNWFVEKAREDRGIRSPDVLEQFVELPQPVQPAVDELRPIAPDLGNLPGSPISEHPAPAPLVRPLSGPSADDILSIIAQEAGLRPDVLANRNPAEVAKEIGAVLRISSEQLSVLLHGRADAKRIARSANRTMIGAADNNALKFAVDHIEALEIMFRKQRSGYLDAPASFEEAFNDLKRHEKATFAAMQNALGRLTEDLTPESVEEKVKGGFGSTKAKAWEIYVQRWNSKTEHLENGMLDVFFGYFSEFYDALSKKPE